MRKLHTKQFCVRVYNRVNESRLIVGIRKASMSQCTKVGRWATCSLRGPTSNSLCYEGLASLAFTAVPSIKCQDKVRVFLLCARYFIMVLCSFLTMKFGYLIHQGEKYSRALHQGLIRRHSLPAFIDRFTTDLSANIVAAVISR